MSLTADIEILDKAQWNHLLEPSPAIYFGKFPYKVSIESNFPKSKRGHYKKPKFSDIAALSVEINSALDNIEGDHRVRLDKGYAHGSSHVYLSSVADTKLVAAAFNERVRSVSGPISQEHLELLQSKSVTCMPKKKLWFGKYDCRVNSWIAFQRRREAKSEDLLNYVAENMEIHCPRRSRNYSEWYSTFYCNFDEFIGILPFIKLSHAAHRLQIDKCILK